MAPHQELREFAVAMADRLGDPHMLAPRPVSYTHLDVYKRQHWLCLKIIVIPAFAGMTKECCWLTWSQRSQALSPHCRNPLPLPPPSTRTVSYTHLDVYKRQEEYDVMLQAGRENRTSPEDLANTYVRGRGEELVPLSNLCLLYTSRCV